MAEPLPPPLLAVQRIWRWLVGVWRAFDADGCFLWAASMAFSTLFALLPLTVLALSFMKAFDAVASYQQTVLDALFANLMLQNQPQVRELLNTFFEKGYESDLMGVLSFIIAAFLWLNSIEQALNHIWKVKRSKSLWERLPVYWTTITLAPLLFGCSLYFSWQVGTLLGDPHSLLYRVVEILLPISLSWLVFFLIYKILPSHAVPTGPALVGGGLAALLWEGSKGVFSYYIAHVASYERLYGLLGTVFSFLLWTYVTWIILLLAAEMVQALEFLWEERHHPPPGQ